MPQYHKTKRNFKKQLEDVNDQDDFIMQEYIKAREIQL
jgi:hypothetical protein